MPQVQVWPKPGVNVPKPDGSFYASGETVVLTFYVQRAINRGDLTTSPPGGPSPLSPIAAESIRKGVLATDLSTLTGPYDNAQVLTLGLTLPGSQAETYYWSSTSTAAESPGSVYGTGSQGRWLNAALAGSGSSASSVAFTTTLPLDGKKVLASTTVTGALAFTLGATTLLGECYVRLTANGVNAPTFSGSFVEHISSSGYDNRVNALNLLSVWYDGVTAWYSFTQPLVSNALQIVRFGALVGVTEGALGSAGYPYTSTTANLATSYTNTPSRWIASGTDGWVQVRVSNPANLSVILGLDLNATSASYYTGYSHGVFPGVNGTARYRVVSTGGAVADASVTRTPLANDLMRLRRAGTSVFAEISSDNGASWSSPIHTWTGASTANIYPKLNYNTSGVVADSVFGQGLT
jgi:hypothetical protein